MKSKLVRGALIGVGALILSTLGIFASDTLQGIDGSILQRAGLGSASLCAPGTTPFTVGERVLCVDMYEASPSAACPLREPRNSIETERNALEQGCVPSSVSGVSPWTYVTLTQAQQLCAKAGKRLPSAAEWYAFALGVNPSMCTIKAERAALTGSSCASEQGIHDAVGNVWEWVNDTVTGATFDGRNLPQEGYVRAVDGNGVATETSPEPDELYGSDYVWTKSEGTHGMIRGGFYGSGSDAGLYALNASVPTNFSTQGVGFRCVEDLYVR